MSLYSKIFLTGLILLACAGCLGKTAPVAAEPPGVLSPRIADQDVTPLATPTDCRPLLLRLCLPLPNCPPRNRSRPTSNPGRRTDLRGSTSAGYYFRVDYDGLALGADGR